MYSKGKVAGFVCQMHYGIFMQKKTMLFMMQNDKEIKFARFVYQVDALSLSKDSNSTQSLSLQSFKEYRTWSRI